MYISFKVMLIRIFKDNERKLNILKNVTVNQYRNREARHAYINEE